MMYVSWYLECVFFTLNISAGSWGFREKQEQEKPVAAKNNWFVCTEKYVQRALLWQWAAGTWRMPTAKKKEVNN